MHVRSFLPILGLTLATFVSAQDGASTVGSGSAVAATDTSASVPESSSAAPQASSAAEPAAGDTVVYDAADIPGTVNPMSANQKRSMIAERGASAVRRNPFKRAQAGICDALPSKWSYMGW
jgi:hypothetical protein